MNYAIAAVILHAFSSGELGTCRIGLRSRLSDQTVELLEGGKLVELVSAGAFFLHHFEDVDQRASRRVDGGGGVHYEVESQFLELLWRVQGGVPALQHVGSLETVGTLADLPHLVVAPRCLHEARICSCLHKVKQRVCSSEKPIRRNRSFDRSIDICINRVIDGYLHVEVSPCNGVR
ncbi:hypothetical protein C4D60_Mb03t18500 [Musa balbisiana]|uniref:Uncharacterized protein n=1 Tax=Musa balbisiana TaxID=52838 RepID=A0A4S8JD97_MUSBA|nr:hypothetical protein C4D60_Mb03t18500 [Musa balbisiana]